MLRVATAHQNVLAAGCTFFRIFRLCFRPLFSPGAVGSQGGLNEHRDKKPRNPFTFLLPLLLAVVFVGCLALYVVQLQKHAASARVPPVPSAAGGSHGRTCKKCCLFTHTSNVYLVYRSVGLFRVGLLEVSGCALGTRSMICLMRTQHEDLLCLASVASSIAEPSTVSFLCPFRRKMKAGRMLRQGLCQDSRSVYL